jgi:tetratricopeptide (TPR) repeat protein
MAETPVDSKLMWLSRAWCAPLISALLVILIYTPTIWNDFVYDDVGIVETDRRLADPGFGLELWVAPWWPWGSVAPASRPLTTFTYWLQTQVHGQDDAAPFRLINVMIFAGLAAMIAVLARTWTGGAWGAWLAGPIFAVHPLRVEVVVGLVGRSEIMAALFSVVAIQLWLQWRSDVTWRRSVLIGLCILAAGWSKEHGFLVAPIIGLWELAARRCAGVELWKPVPWKFVGVVGAVVVLAVGQRAWMGGSGPAQQLSTVGESDNPLGGRFAPPVERVITPLKLVGKAAQMSLFPFERKPRELDAVSDTAPQWGLANSPDYSPPMLMPVGHLRDALVWVGIVVIVGWTLAVFFAWRVRHLVLAPLLAIPVAWAIPSNSFLLIGTIFGDRLLTFVSVFAWLAVATMLRPKRRMIPVAAGGIGIIVAGFVVVATIYSVRWKDQTTLVVSTVSAHPKNARFRGYLAKQLIESGREHPEAREQLYAAAEVHAQRAIRDWPRQSNPYGVLAYVANHRGNRAEAIMYAQYARDHGIRSNLGDQLLEQLGEKPRQEKLMADAKRLIAEHGQSPVNPTARRQLADVMRHLKQYRRAIELYTPLVEASDAEVELLKVYLEALLASQEYKKGLRVYKRMIARDPENGQYLVNAAILAINIPQDLAQARRWLDQVLRAHPRHTHALVAMGDWCLAQEHSAEAMVYYKRALGTVGPNDFIRHQIKVQMGKLKR